MSIQLTTPEAARPGKTHTVVVSFSLHWLPLPTGWAATPELSQHLSSPVLHVTLADAVKNAPNDFTVISIREVRFQGAVVATLLSEEAVKLRGFKRTIEDFMVAQGQVTGSASSD